MSHTCMHSNTSMRKCQRKNSQSAKLNDVNHKGKRKKSIPKTTVQTKSGGIKDAQSAKLNDVDDKGKRKKSSPKETVQTKSRVTTESEKVFSHLHIHKSMNYTDAVPILNEETNNQYIQKGCYFHDKLCGICGSKFVLGKKPGRNEVTISLRKPAHKCENQTKYNFPVV